VRFLLGLAAIAIVGIGLTLDIVRGPDFHRYADTRTWLGIPNAGDVLSNLAFVLVAAIGVRRTYVPLGFAVCIGVAAIGGGSALYHLAPSDTLLAFDWAPIVVTLAALTAAVVEDRGGPGRATFAIGAVLAIGSVAWWLATGGTTGGNMGPYVAVQGAGVVLPLVIASLAPGQIRIGWLAAGIAGFALARVLSHHDRAFLDAIGISGHSLKHVAAAQAAACALRGLLRT
jgi:hypothetical protein